MNHLNNKRNLFCDKVDRMSTTDTRVGDQRPGGRAARVRNDVLRATADLLNEGGYDQMTVEDVAARAGVHKTTVYRRWPTKAELITAAVTEHSAEAVPIPDTGSLASDLQALAREVARNIGTEHGGRRSRSIAAAAAISDDLAENMHAFWADRLGQSAAVVERAISRGELAADSDANLIIETLIGPLWVRLLLTGEPITEDLADRVAALVAAGAKS